MHFGHDRTGGPEFVAERGSLKLGMNRRYRIIFAVVMLVFTLYVGSYWLIRQAHTTLHTECEGCPVGGWEEVRFPGNGPYLMYAPLYQSDKLVGADATFHVVRH